MEDSEYVGVEECAAMLGMSVHTLRNHLALKGSRLYEALQPSRFPGTRRWRFARTQIRRAFEQGQAHAGGKVLPLPRRPKR